MCLDIIPDLGSLKRGEDGSFISPGHLLRIGPATMALGGAVSNTGIACAKLGLETELMGCVGDDLLGETIQAAFRAQHLPNLDFTQGMIVKPGEVSSYTIVVSPPKMDRCFLHCSGANDTFSPADLHPEMFAGARLMHFGYPTLMRGIYSDPKGFAAKLAEIRQLGVLVSMDVTMPDPQGPEGALDWRRWFEIVLPQVDIYLPSLEETLFMLNRPLFEEVSRRASRVVPGPGGSVNPAACMDFERIEDLAQDLLNYGVELAGIKLGDMGLYLRSGESVARCTEFMEPEIAPQWRNCRELSPCFEVKVAGTTGSGDCTIAGFLTGLLAGWAPRPTLDFANAVGACNVQAPDATSGVPDREEVLRRMQTWQRKRNVGKLFAE